jgi:thioredoxin-related protein
MDQYFDSVQLDMWSDVPVVTPSGKATTAKDWAKELGLFYAPSILFFDEKGKEILRIDSVVQFVRLRNVLNYISSKAYLREKNYLVWSAKTRRLIDEMMPRMPNPLSQPTQPVAPTKPQ